MGNSDNMSGFGREAVRVKVEKYEGDLQREWRKFSVDPQITSFEVLQSILVKAFDLKGDFSICSRATDDDLFLPLLSDWDLDAAFLKALNISFSTSTEPCLCLRIDVKSCSDDEWEHRHGHPIITVQESSKLSSPRLHGIFNQVGKTFNMVQRVLNFGEDNNSAAMLQTPRPSLSDSEFRKFLDPVGQILYPKELRTAIYFGGIDASLRKVVWKHILNVYPDGMTGRERMDYIKRKAGEYIGLRETWKKAVAQGSMDGELAYTTGMVRKDVLRTDRHHPFYAGSDDNENIASLYNILTTYALNHPKVSYCQGMSDIASPLLVTMNDEAHAYICFCALMRRLNTNFLLDGIAMTLKFKHLSEGLMYYDPEFHAYLQVHQADDLLFCYRWLLLEMKREFAFVDSLRMLEVLWSSLPADPPHKELKLYDCPFQPVVPVSCPLVVKTIRENPYTKVCALRRQSSSISLPGKRVAPVKRQIHSLDENVGRRIFHDNNKLKHSSTSLDSSPRSRPRSVSPQDSGLGSQHQSIGTSSSMSRSETSKIVKNLNEFLSFASDTNEKPKITLTKSSFDDCSPPDADHGARELRLELEDSRTGGDVKNNMADDIFIWENPLHRTTTVDGSCKQDSCEEVTENKEQGPTLLPPPNEFGGGNPFLMFLCITVLLQHREHIMTRGMDYNEMAMHFDKMVRKHNVIKVLNQARQMYARYIKQHTIAQQKLDSSCSSSSSSGSC